MFLPDAHALALALMLHHGLREWKFRYDASTRRFGVCRHGRKVIGLSRRLVELNGEPEVRNTILHEIAHALCPATEGHGHAWKLKAMEVGARPERCYQHKDVRAPQRKFKGSCPSCSLTVSRDRRTRCECRRCRLPIVWKEAS
jgi:predicted SprT family Zn-dependent metalloprotease